MQINCSHPVSIYNPLLFELVSMYHNIHVNGSVREFINPKNIFYAFKPQNFLPHPSNVPVDDFGSYYVSDNLTGERYPCYIQVPCGHCEICCNAKVNAFVDRCKLETQLYNSKPIFFTLTYDELHKKECGVCVRDVQLFFKRLRINLHRAGYREKIRYCYAAEYGRRTSRPHGHGILWNLHQTDILSYLRITDIIKKSWSNGFVQLRFVDPSDDKAFYYTAKYLRKNCNVPSGCNKPFLLLSNRGGSIGSAFLDRIRKKAVKHLNTQIKYVNKWNGRVYDVQTNRYMLNRLVPSLSRSLPYSLKLRVRRFISDYAILRSRSTVDYNLFDSRLDCYYRFFHKYFYVPSIDVVRLDSSRSDGAILREMLQDEIYIDNALSKGEQFFEDALYFANQRERYLVKLFLNAEDINFSDKSYKIRRFNQMAAEREIF